MNAPFTFVLPADLAAREPPERRGLARDRVRLMVQSRSTGGVEHTRFNHLGDYLRPGDLLVFNSSRTLPAVLDGREPSAGVRVELRLAEHLVDDSWLALLLVANEDRLPSGSLTGRQIELGDGLRATIGRRDRLIPRLWRVRFSRSGPALIDTIYRIGRPVRYEHVSEPWGLDYYQTVYAREPGSAEMPSAGRAFTWQLLFDLRREGIDVADVVLHTGLSSYLDDDLDGLHLASEEEYVVSEPAAEKVNRALATGRRVIAIGTTVVRALESTVGVNGRVHPGHRYTRLRVTADHPLRAVHGLLTGLHEPEASHLDLLTAFVPAERIRWAYQQAVGRGYLWHEFGDLNLLL